MGKAVKFDIRFSAQYYQGNEERRAVVVVAISGKAPGDNFALT